MPPLGSPEPGLEARSWASRALTAREIECARGLGVGRRAGGVSPTERPHARSPLRALSSHGLEEVAYPLARLDRVSARSRSTLPWR
jgi:hypothetical protein